MINRFIAVGNLVKKPEFKSLSTGHLVADFTIAQNEKTKKGDMTYYFNCVAFGKKAEFITEYGEKGRKIYIEGSYKPEKYVNKDGKDAWSHKIQVSEFQFLDFQRNDTKNESVTQQTPQAPFVTNVQSDFNDSDIPF